jgi:hypothetical protein
MRLHYFLGACIAAFVLIVSLGAPVSAVAIGIALAAAIRLSQEFATKARSRKPKP